MFSLRLGCIEKTVRMVFGFIRCVQDCDRLQLLVERQDGMLCFSLLGQYALFAFVLKHESMFTLDHKGNLVTLARWFHLTAFARTLSHVDVGVGSLQWQESLE